MVAIPVITPEQAAAWDRLSGEAGIADATLMETAGRGVALLATERFGDRLRAGVLVACGAGNNGGDGWVVARALHRLGVPVWVTSVPATNRSSLCVAMAGLARADGVREVAPDGPWPSAGVVVDALLGTGATGPLRGAVAAMAERIADLDLPLLAVDGPTGLDLLDGVQYGPLHAALTVTFGGYRRGHLLARDDVGDVVAIDIGFPPPSVDWPTLFTDRQAIAALPAFRADFHKGDRGRIVIVGGSPGMTGAARLAARSAFAAGAGFAHIAAPAESAAILAQAEPDIQTCVRPDGSEAGAALADLLARADATIVGPGLGLHPDRAALVVAVLEMSRAVVVDADALSGFHGSAERLAAAAKGRAVVLTPHLGEFRALFPDLAAAASVDPWGAAEQAATRVGATVLLKGVPTVIASPGAGTVTVASGNPGLATGGSGDTLSGLIATFLAQGVAAPAAAALGAHALGRAADLAAARHSARAVRPMDIIAAFGDLWRHWALAEQRPPAARLPVLHELERPRHH
jgi:NAD(P)H-hydrate epimerase